MGSTQVGNDLTGAQIAADENEISSGTGTDYKFTDKTTDETSGLSYFGARFYDPETGRFITADTYTNLPNDERNFFITADGSFMALSDDPAKYNQYSYFLNNPINRVDPDGHFVFLFALVPEAIQMTILGIGATVMVVDTIKSMIDMASKQAKSHTKAADTRERSVGQRWQDYKEH